MKLVEKVCQRLGAAGVGFKRITRWSPAWGHSDRVEARVGEIIVVAEENSATGYCVVRLVLPRKGERPERAVIWDARHPEKGWQGATHDPDLVGVIALLKGCK